MCSAFCLFSQTPPLEHLSAADGLPSNNCFRVLQDSKGYIWVCTDNGLCKYDGYNFKNYSTKDGLPYNDIHYLFEDSHHRLWLCGYTTSFCYIDLDSGEIVTIPNFLKVDHTYNSYFLECNDGSIVSGILENTYYYRIYPKLKKVELVTLSHPNLYSCQKDIGVSQLHTFKGDSSYFKKVGTDGQLMSPFTMSAIGTNFRVVLDNKNIRVLTHTSHRYKRLIEISKGAGMLENFYPFGKKFLYLRFTNRSFVIDTCFEPQPQFDFLDRYDVVTIYEDREENYWCTSKMNGIYFLAKENKMVQVIDLPPTPKPTEIICITGDQKSKVYLGTSAGEIFEFSKGESLSRIFSLKTKGYFRKLLFHPIYQKLIFITNLSKVSSGFLSVKPIELQQESLAPQLNWLFNDLKVYKNRSYTDKNSYKDLKLDQGAMRLTSSNAVECEGEGKRSFTRRLSCSAKDRVGYLWCGGPDGLFRSKDSVTDELTQLRKRFPVLNDPINELYVDESNGVWVLMANRGIYLLKGEKLFQIKSLTDLRLQNLGYYKQQLFCNSLHQIFSLKFDSNRQQIVAESLPLLNFGSSNIIHTFLIQGDELFIASLNGLHVLPFPMPKSSPEKPIYPSKVQLGSIVENGNSTSISGNYKDNMLKVDFSTLYFGSIGTATFEYLLEGLDQNWRPCIRNCVEVWNLSPGSYRLKIRGTDALQNRYTLLSPISVVVHPFWLFSWWAKLAGSIIGVGVVVVFITLRINRLRRKAEAKIELNRNIANLRLEAITNKMNPHFVFNCLNSIQSLILQQEISKASLYLNKFSKLMRRILESSYTSFNTIHDELQNLQLYLELEKLRFGDNFTFRIQVDAGIDIQAELPTMLLQPYVENAIIHGVSKQTSKGEVVIVIQKVDDVVRITIDDNGIGRLASAQIKKLKAFSEKSRGNQLTEEKIQMINQIYGLEVSVTIIDKYNDIGTSAGTKVVLLIKTSKDEST